MAFLVFQLQPGRGPRRTAQINERMLAPLPQSIGAALAEAIQRGRNCASVEEQFRRQTEIGRGVTLPWKRTRPFGTRPAPARTLHATGALEAAWTGRGAGSVVHFTGRSVSVGVDRVQFPQVTVFQRRSPTLIRVTPKMRMFLGMEFGVWLRSATTSITVDPRRVAINGQILDRARRIVTSYFLRGEAVARRVAA